MSRLALLLALALTACNKEDPCAKYDTAICAKYDQCSVFTAVELTGVGTGWCIPKDAVAAAQVCMTSPAPECDAGQNYAAPADADGNPTDTCYSYTGCEPPAGWVDCTTMPAFDLEFCDP